MSISSVMRMTSSSPVERKNYWKEKSNPSSSSFCKNEGLNFLRRRPSSRTWRKALISSDKTCAGIPNGKLLIKPSKKNVKTFLDGIRGIIKAALGMSAADLIDQLNPKIRGWANYHRHVVSKRMFARVDYATSSLVCGNGHGEGTRTKPRAGSNRNTLSGIGDATGPSSVKRVMTRDSHTKSGCCHASSTPIKRHVKVKGDANPYDPAYETYFAVT